MPFFKASLCTFPQPTSVNHTLFSCTCSSFMIFLCLGKVPVISKDNITLVIQQQEAYRKLGGTSELTIRITDSLANTALHKASEAGNLPCLQWLVGRLPNDCLRNITNHDNLTPLAVAVKVRWSEICQKWTASWSC